jgi:hypothetical protein
MLEIAPGSKEHLAAASLDFLETDNVAPELHRCVEIRRDQCHVTELCYLRHRNTFAQGSSATQQTIPFSGTAVRASGRTRR